MASSSDLTDGSIQRLAEICCRTASEDPELTAVLHELRRTFRSHAAVLTTPMLEDISQFEWLGSGGAKTSGEEYQQHWISHDPWRQGWMQRGYLMQPGETRCGAQLLPKPALARTAFYDGYARRHEIEDVLIMIVDGAPGEGMHIAALHRSKSEAPFSADEARALKSLHSCLCSALRLRHMAVNGRRHSALQRQQAETLLRGQVSAVWVLGPDLQPVFANDSAGEWTRKGLCQLSASGRLYRLGSLHDRELRELLAEVDSAVSLQRTISLGPDAVAGLAELRIELLAPELRASLAGGRYLLSAVLHDVEQINRLRLEALASQWRLTAQESRVLALLSAGSSAREIADQLSLSMHTVRSHIRNLVAKTGARRLMDLLRAVGAAR